MSLETLNIINGHKKEAVENSPSSEEFSIVGGESFKGIFDESHIEGSPDSGGVSRQELYPRIMVDSRPDGLVQKTTVIVREDGTEHKFFKYAPDEEGIGLIWLL